MTCAPSEDSDQPGHGSAQSDQGLHCALIGSQGSNVSFMRIEKTLIRLGGYPALSESSMGAQEILLVLSSGGSICVFQVSALEKLGMVGRHYHFILLKYFI